MKGEKDSNSLETNRNRSIFNKGIDGLKTGWKGGAVTEKSALSRAWTKWRKKYSEFSYDFVCSELVGDTDSNNSGYIVSYELPKGQELVSVGAEKEGGVREIFLRSPNSRHKHAVKFMRVQNFISEDLDHLWNQEIETPDGKEFASLYYKLSDSKNPNTDGAMEGIESIFITPSGKVYAPQNVQVVAHNATIKHVNVAVTDSTFAADVKNGKKSWPKSIVKALGLLPCNVGGFVVSVVTFLPYQTCKACENKLLSWDNKLEKIKEKIENGEKLTRSEKIMCSTIGKGLKKGLHGITGAGLLGLETIIVAKELAITLVNALFSIIVMEKESSRSVAIRAIPKVCEQFIKENKDHLIKAGIIKDVSSDIDIESAKAQDNINDAEIKNDEKASEPEKDVNNLQDALKKEASSLLQADVNTGDISSDNGDINRESSCKDNKDQGKDTEKASSVSLKIGHLVPIPQCASNSNMSR